MLRHFDLESAERAGKKLREILEARHRSEDEDTLDVDDDQGDDDVSDEDDDDEFEPFGPDGFEAYRCRQCGEVFYRELGLIGRKPMFCSRSCKDRASNRRRRERQASSR